MNFNFFESFYQCAKALNPKMRLAFYDAILDYFFQSIEPDAKNPVYGIFLAVKPNIDNSKRRKQSGSMGGSKRQANRVANEVANAKQTPSKPSSKEGSKEGSKPSTEKEKEKEKDKDNTSPLPPCEGGRGAEAPVRIMAEELFDSWWEAYPRHDGKKPARDKFVRLMLNEGKNPVGMAGLADRLMDAVAAAKQSEQWTKDGGQFIPMPATWLNQRRWEDEGLAQNGADAAADERLRLVDEAAEKMSAILGSS